MRTRRPPPPPMLPGLDDSETRTFQPPPPEEMQPPAPRQRASTPAPDVPTQPDTAWPMLKPGVGPPPALEEAPTLELAAVRSRVWAVLADGDWHPYEDVWKAGQGLYHQVTVWGPDREKWPAWLLPVDCRADGQACVALWDGEASRIRRGLAKKR